MAARTLNNRTTFACIHYDVPSAPPITKNSGLSVWVPYETLMLSRYAFESVMGRLEPGPVADMIREEYEEANR